MTTLAQTIFDTVAAHLLKQGRRSKNIVYDVSGRAALACAYRGIDQTSCAVGCLIDDKAYDSAFENRTAVDYRVRAALAASIHRRWPEYAAEDVPLGLITQLQAVHDGAAEDWSEGSGFRGDMIATLRAVARPYNFALNHPELQEAKA